MSLDWAKKNWLVLTVSTLWFITVLLILFISSRSPTTATPPANNANAESAMTDTERQQMIDGHIEAIMRGWVVTDVCYDKTNNTFLFKVFDHEPVKGHTDAGWYMLTSYKFVRLDNGTYALLQSEQSDRIDIVSTGLYCKSQPVDPSWGKTWIDE